MRRREFLAVTGSAALSRLAHATLRHADDRNVIIVLFGGGTRSADTVDDPAHRSIPELSHTLIPRGTLFQNMRVEGRVVHPNSAGSIVTGHWEWADLDWSQPVAHPTVFELFRSAATGSDLDAWAFVYASILSGVAHSSAPGYGPEFAANVLTPPTIDRAAAEEMERVMRAAAVSGSRSEGLRAAAECEHLARSASRITMDGLRSPEAARFGRERNAAWLASNATTSHDAFLADSAIACMQQFAPRVLLVAFGEIDCAHYGSWSRYVDAIKRTDALTARLWRATQELPAYSGRTFMLILPDHGRELERPGGAGFIHHSDFYTNEDADEGCRRVWMLALGPGIAAGRTCDEAVPITTVAPTACEMLRIESSRGCAASVLEVAAG